MTEYFVYILSNKSRMLYVGVTNNLERRVFEHKMKLIPGFTQRYGLTKLVYYESTGDVMSAVSREKEIKGWVRRKKVALIHSFNPEWKDLSQEWAPPHPETLRYTQGDKSEHEDEKQTHERSAKGGEVPLPPLLEERRLKG